MTLDVALIAIRFVHYLSVSVLFGGALFPLYALTSGESRHARLRWLNDLLAGCAGFACLSAIAWLGMTRGATLETAALMAGRIVVSAVLAVVLFHSHLSAAKHVIVVATAFLLLASLAAEGHAAGYVAKLIDVCHLTASAVWIGALVVFSRMALTPTRRWDDIHALHVALARFSTVGTGVVAVLLWSGIMHVGFSAGFDTLYGGVLLAKLGAFAAMLFLAALNRLWLTPRLSRAIEAEGGLTKAVAALRISLIVETALAVAIIALVAWLGTLDIPR